MSDLSTHVEFFISPILFERVSVVMSYLYILDYLLSLSMLIILCSALVCLCSVNVALCDYINFVSLQPSWRFS